MGCSRNILMVVFIYCHYTIDLSEGRQTKFSVSIEAHPYQVALIFRPSDDYFSGNLNQGVVAPKVVFGQTPTFKKGSLNLWCGGSIIADIYILTTASCTRAAHSDPSHFLVSVGSGSYESGGQIFNVKRITNHAEYNTGSEENDISVLELEEKLTWSKNVRPVSLPTWYGSLPEPGKLAIVTGWRTSDGYISNVSDHLMGGSLRIYHTQSCKDIYFASPIQIDYRQICAGNYIGGTYRGVGDVGAALMVDDVQHGIMTSTVGVFSSVLAFKNFIYDVVKTHPSLEFWPRL